MLAVCVLLLGLAGAGAQAPLSCLATVTANCHDGGLSSWTAGTCNSVFGGFKGNSNNLHRIILDDFSDSMKYLLMASHFNSDRLNRLGFSKYFMALSDKMWGRGKEVMKYVLKRGGKMGDGFQLPRKEHLPQNIGDFIFSSEMAALGESLDLMKTRADNVLTAYKHSLSTKQEPHSLDAETARMLEGLSEDYVGDIHDLATKLNTLGRMVKADNGDDAMALHLFDKMLQ